MPPSPKFTRDEIVAAALQVVSERGKEALSAREVAAVLGSSARPIFTVFSNMEELQQEVINAAWDKYNAFVSQSMNFTPAFKKFGMLMIQFAKNEPKLFQLLFMTENARAEKLDDIFEYLGETATMCVDIIQSDYKLPRGYAKKLFELEWIFALGISSLCATDACRFSDEEISDMLSREFRALLDLAMSGKLGESDYIPVIRQIK
ncbi:MAG: TetR/AcrR family transcriptional regulator [Acutalibacteraceae bacterium]